MADIFSAQDARNLLKDKFIFMLGDSNMRATYKDLVALINRNHILDLRALRNRDVESFEGDRRLLFHGLVKGRDYVESREFVKHGVHIEFHFITRCYTPEIETFFQKMKNRDMKLPDVIIMNSCIWDISRWGPNGVNDYKVNMKKLMLLLDECMPKETLFIWTTTLPISTSLTGGLMIKQINFLQPILRFEVMEANLFCRHLVVSHGYDVLDTHYHLRMQIHRRLKDGIHYGPLPVRFISNLLLTHIALSWDAPLPGNHVGIALERVIESGCLGERSEEVELPPIPGVLDVDISPKNNNPARGKNRNRPLARGKRQLNYNNRGGYHHNGMMKQRKQPPPWLNDGEGQWMHANHQPPPPHLMHARPPKFWPGNANNHNMYSGPHGPHHPPWNDFNEANYCQSEYADFDHVGGPMPKNRRYQKKRPTPY